MLLIRLTLKETADPLKEQERRRKTREELPTVPRAAGLMY